jgi:predicted unusual protein kinase regulating ubiquinone biosynthesis (AarF/ABC1/UbiB family)
MDYAPSESVLATRGAAARSRLATGLMTFFISQLVREGMVHGDPHLGNMGVTRNGGGLVLYDFGNVIYVPHGYRQRMKELICQLVVGNTRAVAKSLRGLDIDVLDEDGVERAVVVYMEYMRTIDVTVLQRAFGPDTVLPMRFTDQILRLVRVYALLEGVCKQLDPAFNYFAVLASFDASVVLDEDFLAFKIQSDASAFVAAATNAGRAAAAASSSSSSSSSSTSSSSNGAKPPRVRATRWPRPSPSPSSPVSTPGPTAWGSRRAVLTGAAACGALYLLAGAAL